MGIAAATRRPLAAFLIPIPDARKTLAVMRRRHARRRGLCLSCGYDLRASPGACPECGVILSPAPPRPTVLGAVNVARYLCAAVSMVVFSSVGSVGLSMGRDAAPSPLVSVKCYGRFLTGHFREKHCRNSTDAQRRKANVQGRPFNSASETLNAALNTDNLEFIRLLIGSTMASLYRETRKATTFFHSRTPNFSSSCASCARIPTHTRDGNGGLLLDAAVDENEIDQLRLLLEAGYQPESYKSLWRHSTPSSG